MFTRALSRVEDIFNGITHELSILNGLQAETALFGHDMTIVKGLISVTMLC